MIMKAAANEWVVGWYYYLFITMHEIAFCFYCLHQEILSAL